MKKYKIKRTKGMSYKNYIKEDVICCYECKIKVSYFVNCSDKLSHKVIKNLTEERSITPYIQLQIRLI